MVALASAMDIPIPSMQSTVKAALASARAQSSMDPVKLIASDGSEIIIDRRAALISGTIKSMLAGPGVQQPGERFPASAAIFMTLSSGAFCAPRQLQASMLAVLCSVQNAAVGAVSCSL